MASKILQRIGTIIVLGKSATHAPADINNLGSITDEIDLTSLAAQAARQSNKFDLGGGGAVWARDWNIMAAIETATAFIPGELIDFYLAFSPNATPANANPGGVSGVNSAYTGYSANLDDSLKQLMPVGSLAATVQATPTVQKAIVGSFFPLQRYASFIVVNKSATDDLHSNMVQMSVSITPIEDESQ